MRSFMAISYVDRRISFKEGVIHDMRHEVSPLMVKDRNWWEERYHLQYSCLLHINDAQVS